MPNFRQANPARAFFGPTPPIRYENRTRSRTTHLDFVEIPTSIFGETGGLLKADPGHMTTGRYFLGSFLGRNQAKNEKNEENEKMKK